MPGPDTTLCRLRLERDLRHGSKGQPLWTMSPLHAVPACKQLKGIHQVRWWRRKRSFVTTKLLPHAADDILENCSLPGGKQLGIPEAIPNGGLGSGLEETFPETTGVRPQSEQDSAGHADAPQASISGFGAGRAAVAVIERDASPEAESAVPCPPGGTGDPPDEESLQWDEPSAKTRGGEMGVRPGSTQGMGSPTRTGMDAPRQSSSVPPQEDVQPEQQDSDLGRVGYRIQAPEYLEDSKNFLADFDLMLGPHGAYGRSLEPFMDAEERARYEASSAFNQPGDWARPQSGEPTTAVPSNREDVPLRVPDLRGEEADGSAPGPSGSSGQITSLGSGLGPGEALETDANMQSPSSGVSLPSDAQEGLRNAAGTAEGTGVRGPGMAGSENPGGSIPWQDAAGVQPGSGSLPWRTGPESPSGGPEAIPNAVANLGDLRESSSQPASPWTSGSRPGGALAPRTGAGMGLLEGTGAGWGAVQNRSQRAHDEDGDKELLESRLWEGSCASALAEVLEGCPRGSLVERHVIAGMLRLCQVAPTTGPAGVDCTAVQPAAHRLTEEALHLVPSFSPEQLALLLRCLAYLGNPEPALLVAIRDRLPFWKAQDYPPRSIADVLVALARLQVDVEGSFPRTFWARQWGRAGRISV
eukprot:jgi/Botrbrau1/13109/Bobra.0187s0066.1